MLVALLSDGHVLLEDVPGHRQDRAREGARQHARRHALAHPVHARPAARPTSRASRSTTRTRARSSSTPGRSSPSIVLADEINRASPKTQSALLEVMEEGSRHRRRRRPLRGRAVHGDRDPEPGRAGGHLLAARGAARPLPHQDLARLPRPRRRPSPCCWTAANRARASKVSPIIARELGAHDGGARLRGASSTRRSWSTSTDIVDGDPRRQGRGARRQHARRARARPRGRRPGRSRTGAPT